MTGEAVVAVKWSHPTRVRGLKPAKADFILDAAESHPTRVRGLKQDAAKTFHNRTVAPHTGAWIETGSSIVSAVPA